jgi:hypothetical protein
MCRKQFPLIPLVLFTLAVLTGGAVLSAHSGPAEPQFRLEARGPAQPLVPGEDITVQLVLSTAGPKSYGFLLGSIPQVFGIYIVGPKGPIQPDPTKVLPENWMHQQHSAATPIQVAKGLPYRVTISLADYFATKDPKQFGPGLYQVKLKFLETGLGMKTPLESRPVRVEIKPPAKTPQEARAAFPAQVRSVARTMPEARRKMLESRLGDPKQLAVGRQSYAAALARVTDTLSDRERPNLIIYGTLTDLRRAGDCWALQSTGHFGSEFSGYVDVNTGRLVFLWIIPEG